MKLHCNFISVELSRCHPQMPIRARGDFTHPFTVHVGACRSKRPAPEESPKTSFIPAPLMHSRAVHPQRPGTFTFGRETV